MEPSAGCDRSKTENNVLANYYCCLASCIINIIIVAQTL
jgi:hypothetical protein